MKNLQRKSQGRLDRELRAKLAADARRAKRRGDTLWAQACEHYLTLNQSYAALPFRKGAVAVAR